HLDTILRLAACAEYKDHDTATHLVRISRYSAVVAETLGLDANRVELIQYASPMHDIGKMGIPDEILNKPGAYTAEERAIMERHPIIGANILKPHDTPLMHVSHEIALHHHEKWDGTGYPNGLVGEAIPLSARVVALVDVFDALVEKRCYKPAMPFDEAINEIIKGRGTHFDPACLDAFISSLANIRRIFNETHEV
ncbi:MAG: HD domain-containing protein, partial [Verrucomicrobia bacterium]|nr:HD domain-containing protein [Verrucomicrobiota bacterium]